MQGMGIGWFEKVVGVDGDGAYGMGEVVDEEFV